MIFSHIGEVTGPSAGERGFHGTRLGVDPVYKERGHVSPLKFWVFKENIFSFVWLQRSISNRLLLKFCASSTPKPGLEREYR